MGASILRVMGGLEGISLCWSDIAAHPSEQTFPSCGAPAVRTAGARLTSALIARMSMTGFTVWVRCGRTWRK